MTLPPTDDTRPPPRVLLIGASGYIGSRITRDFHARQWSIVGCDGRAPHDRSKFARFFVGPYKDLPDKEIADADVVLWFAGHSSVRVAQNAPWESLENNVFDLARLFSRIGASGKVVIYASSASVLSSAEDHYSLVANEVSSNAYDAGKLAFDVIAPHLGVHCLGLRLATVSGWSPAMRWDLVFNSMNLSAAKDKIVRVQNSSNFRSLLFIDDLSLYLQSTIVTVLNTPRSGASRTVLGSWSGTIGQLAAEIAEFWGVPIEYGENRGAYSFVLNDRELSSACAGPKTFYKSMAERCALFARQNDWQVAP